MKLVVAERIEQLDIVDAHRFDAVAAGDVHVIGAAIGADDVHQLLIDLRDDDPAEIAAFERLLGEQARLDRPESEPDEDVLAPLDC